MKEQIRTLEKHNLPENWKSKVLFIDEVFGADEEWMKEFESIYPKEIGLPFLMETLPHKNMLGEKTLDMLVNSGVDTINFGIQTGSDYIRNKILGRPTKNKEIVRISKEIVKRGITIRNDLIAGNPYETEETLKETIKLLLQLPKPLSFNLFRLQWFPDYPLTKRAIKDGIITEEDATVEALAKTTTNDWAFVPKGPLNDKNNLLANIIWLIVWHHVSDNSAKYAVFGNSITAKTYFYCLNIKAIFLGKLVGVGGLSSRNAWMARIIEGLGLVARGEMKDLMRKVRVVLFKYLRARSGQPQAVLEHSGYHKMQN